jgi:hypothetical protein
MSEVVARLRKVATGEIREHSMDVSPEYATAEHQWSWWVEGNGGCDCNRSYFWSDYAEDEDDTCGDERYELVGLTIDGRPVTL